MGNLLKTINIYYDLFESYRIVIYLKNFMMWTLLLSIIIFIYSFYWCINIDAFPYFPAMKGDSRVIPCIALEAIILFSGFALTKQRDSLVIDKLQKTLATNEKNLNKLKKIWLNKTLGIESTEYLEIAEKIDKYINLRQKHQSISKFNFNYVSSFIFQPESKNRLLAMFMGLCAAAIGLSIAGGANINNIFEFYDAINIKTIILIDIAISSFLLLGILIFRHLFLFIFEMIGVFFDKVGKNKEVSKRRLRLFINELLKFYDLPKGRVKVKGDID